MESGTATGKEVRGDRQTVPLEVGLPICPRVAEVIFPVSIAERREITPPRIVL